MQDQTRLGERHSRVRRARLSGRRARDYPRSGGAANRPTRRHQAAPRRGSHRGEVGPACHYLRADRFRLGHYSRCSWHRADSFRRSGHPLGPAPYLHATPPPARCLSRSTTGDPATPPSYQAMSSTWRTCPGWFFIEEAVSAVVASGGGVNRGGSARPPGRAPGRAPPPLHRKGMEGDVGGFLAGTKANGDRLVPQWSALGGRMTPAPRPRFGPSRRGPRFTCRAAPTTGTVK